MVIYKLFSPLELIYVLHKISKFFWIRDQLNVAVRLFHHYIVNYKPIQGRMWPSMCFFLFEFSLYRSTAKCVRKSQVSEFYYELEQKTYSVK